METQINRNQALSELQKHTSKKNAKLIESGIYEYSVMYVENHEYSEDFIFGVYNDKLSNILHELKHITKNKKELLKNPKEIPFLDPHVINEQNWEEEKRRIDLREFKKNNIGATDLYKCRKCNESKCTVYQAQTRSADEPMTLFITCLVCYNTFKK